MSKLKQPGRIEWLIELWAAVFFGFLFLLSVVAFFFLEFYPYLSLMLIWGTGILSLTTGSAAYLLRKKMRKKGK